MAKRCIYKAKEYNNSKDTLFWMEDSDAKQRNNYSKNKADNYIKVCDGKLTPKSKRICPINGHPVVRIEGSNNKSYYRYNDYSMREIT